MGFLQAGTNYGMAGGDAALAKRQRQFFAMQKTAREFGLLDEEQEAPDPTGFKGFFFRAVDLISRPNYAIAGFVDTVAGQGAPGEYAFERAFREMFSGIGGLEGDKEMFGEVLEQMGYGKGGELSDLIGENGITKRFNPSTRGAVGLALDIFTDPLTYISAPVKNAATLMGQGKRLKYLNKTGMEALEGAKKAELENWRVRLEMPDSASDVEILDSMRKSAIFRKEVGEEAAALYRTKTFGRLEADAFVREQAEAALEKTGRTDIFEKEGLRFRLPGTDVVDIPVVADQIVKYAGEKAGSWLKMGMNQTDIGKAMMKFGFETLDHVQKLVSRHPLLAKFHKDYIRMDARRFQKFQAAEHIAGMEANQILAGLTKKQLANDDLWKSFYRAVEDPLDEAIGDFAQLAKSEGIEDGAGLVTRWRQFMDRQQVIEVRAGLLDEAAYLERRGRHVPKLTMGIDQSKRDLMHRASSRSLEGRGADVISGRDLGNFNKAAGFRNMDEFLAAADDLGVNPNEVVLNPRAILQARLKESYQTLINQKFMNDVASRFGWKTHDAVSKMVSVLAKRAERVSKKDAQEIQDTLLRDITVQSKSTVNAEVNKFVNKLFRESGQGKFEEQMQVFWESMIGDTLLTKGQALELSQRSLKEYKRYQQTITRAKVADAQAVSRNIVEQSKLLRGMRASQKRRMQMHIDDLGYQDEIQILKENIVRMREGLAEMRKMTNMEALTPLRNEIKKQSLALRQIRQLLRTPTKDIKDTFKIQFDDVNALLKDMRARQSRMVRLRETYSEGGRVLREGVEAYGNPLVNLIRGALLEGTLPPGVAKKLGLAGKELDTVTSRPIDEAFAASKVPLSKVEKARKEAREEFMQQHTRELIEKKDLERVRSWSATKQAAYFAAAMGEIDDMATFTKFMTRYKDDLAKLDKRLKGTNFSEIVDEMYEGQQLVLRDAFGQAYKPIRLGDGRTIDVPLGIKLDHENFHEVFVANKEVGALLNAYDKLNNWFKLSVTRYFPSFHVRNAYSNVASVFTDIGIEALIPIRAKQALDILRGADGTLKLANGKSMTYAALRDEIDALGVRVDKLLLAELTGQAKGDPIEAFLQWRIRKEGLDEKAARIAEKAYSIPNNVENHARVFHYISLRRRGYSPEDASYQVNKFLFDYGDLSAVEKGAFRRLFPFWTWNRKNAEQQIRNLYERPGRLATQIKILQQDRGPDGDMIPEYLRGQMSVKLQSGPKGELWMTGIDLPISATDILWAGSIGKTFREQISMVTPFIKTPLEVGVGREFFTDRGTRGIGDIQPSLGAAMNRNMPQKMKDYFELENIGTKQRPKWVANRLKIHLVFKGGLISRFVSQGVQVDKFAEEIGRGDQDAGLRALFKLFAGLDLRVFELEDKEKRVLYNRARRLEELMIKRGLMREYTKPFIPKEKKAANTQRPFSGLGGGGGG